MNEILSYIEMCQREGVSLQKGMNFQIGNGYSIILMSVRPNAPYQDRFEDELTVIYEGHDAPKSPGLLDPKLVDQPAKNSSGSLTENGKFHKAAHDFKAGLRSAERVKVYEKVRPGIWSYNGLFDLVDSWREQDGKRWLFKYKLIAVQESLSSDEDRSLGEERQRMIPSAVKLEVWKRDRGQCVRCGATDELHFDHIIPYSKGGTSIKSENIQLLCARHNLMKRDKIE